jgi:SPX domain protein involved in polyphosphate accumulation
VLDRYESKYTIPEYMVDEISLFIAPYCSLDEYSAVEESGFYTVNSLYFDTPHYQFLEMRMMRAESRFSMRIRSYGDNPVVPYFFEIKSKRGDVIRKYRARIFEDNVEQAVNAGHVIDSESTKDEDVNAGLFRRTAGAYNAHPVVFTQYKRKAYAGDTEEYARVTFDKKLRYAERRDYRVSCGNEELQPTDIQDCFDDGCSVVLELKCYTSFVPLWMVDLVRTFNLKRRGFSKYGNAMRQVFGAYPDFIKNFRPPAMLDDFECSD